MSFLNPLMLFGAFAAAIPIAMHFFYRARYRPLPWAAMKFLRLAIEQTSRRLRFQELVLLILRILVCLLLAFALARPSSDAITATSGRGESVDAVIIVDTSYSMSARVSETLTRLDQAKEAALKIIDNLPRNSTVQIVSCSRKAVNLGPQSPSNLDQARLLVKKLKTDSLSTDYFDGLAEAQSCFSKTEGGTKEVYLISDMQRSGWENQTSAVRSKCQEIKDVASIYLVRVGEQAVKNVTIVGLLPQTEIPRAGASVGFTVLLRNSGTSVVENLNVSLSVDGQKSFSKDSVAVNKIEVGETKPVTITGKIDQSGWRLLTARLNDRSELDADQFLKGKKADEPERDRANRDNLDEDNTYRLLLQVHDKIRVLVIDGTPNSGDPSNAGSFFLANALLPLADDPDRIEAYHLTVAVVRPENVNDGVLADRDVCMLANVAIDQLDAGFVKALNGFVRSGKGLFISTGSNVKPAAYNKALGNLLPTPLLDEAPYLAPRDNLAAPDLQSFDLYSFLAKIREKGNHPLQSLNAGFTGAITPVLDPKSEKNNPDMGRVLLRFNDGRPMLLSKKVGAGETMLLTTSVDNTWSVLCRLRAFVPFINGCVNQLVQSSGAIYNHIAGDVVKWTPADSEKEYYVSPPEGERLFLGKPVTYDGATRLPAFDTTRAGVYVIAPSDAKQGEGDKLVFNADLEESENLESLTDEQIDAQLDFQPVHLKTGFDGSSFTGTERSRNEWTIWVLTALLIFTLGETLFAWFCGRAW